MRILLIIQKSQLRGAEVFASQLGNHLLQTGHQVMLVSLFKGDAKLPFHGDVTCLEAADNSRFLDVKGWRKLNEIIRKFDPDIVQANAGDTLKYAVFSKIIFRWKQPILFRNASVISLYIKRTLVKWFNSFLFRFVKCVISVSRNSREDLIRLYPRLESRSLVIPIGVEEETVEQGNPSNRYLLHVGGFTFEKNHERLLHIFKSVVAEFPDVSLWLVGDGPRKREIEKVSEALKLQHSVRFLGYHNNVKQIMRSSLGVLLPSVIEGLPGVLLEAQYCRVPVIAYDVGGISEIIRHHDTGWLVPKGDERGFENAVRELLSASPEQNEKMTNRAFRQVTEKYTMNVITEKFINTFEQVISHERSH